MYSVVVALAEVTVRFLSLEVMLRLDKRVVFNGIPVMSEPHLHVVTPETSMVDGLADLEAYLTLNGWPNISSDDRALILNITNAARGVAEQRAPAELA